MKEDLEGFEEFWKVFPRRVAKQAALRMYKRAQKLTTSAEILRAAKLYAQERLGQDAAFTKHPATWLNAGCWGDYPQEEKTETSTAGFYAAFTSPELDAWNMYGRKTRGMSYPADKRGGWFFPTRWPPGYDVNKSWDEMWSKPFDFSQEPKHV